MKSWNKNARSLAALATGAIVAMLALSGWTWHREEAPPPANEAETAEVFSAIDCQPRLFESRPSAALMFNAPLEGGQPLDKRLLVIDLGESTAQEKARSNPPRPIEDFLPPASATRVANAVWVQSDNPRMVYLQGIKPRHRYRISLQPELKAANGAQLKQALACEISATPMPASFHFASKGTVLPAGLNGGLPIVTVNVPEVDIQFLRVEPAQLSGFLQRISGVRPAPKESAEDERAGYEDEYYYYGAKKRPQGALGGYELDALRAYSKSVYLARFKVDGRSDRRNITHIPVEDIEELKAPGVYIAVMAEPGRFGVEFQTTYFYVSDIGLHVRRHASSIEAFATSLKSAEALKGVEFRALDEYGRTIARGASDRLGYAHLPVQSNRTKVIVAQRGDDFSLLSLIEPALDLSEFDTQGHLSRPVKIYAYTGRDLYRPGESLNVSVLVRDADGRALPPAPIGATLKRADGKTVQQLVLEPDRATPGFMHARVKLPTDAQTGTWALEFRVDPAAKKADHRMALRVEDFLPERMKLDLQSEKASLVANDIFSIDVRGDYLYGAPAARNSLQAVLVTERHRVPFPQKWPGFEFGDSDEDSLKRREELPFAKLDEKGTKTLTVPLPAPAASPLLLRTVVSLQESGGRPVVRSIERSLWPAEAMIGLRPLWNGPYAPAREAAEVELIRVDRQGKFTPLSRATVRVYREDRDYYWMYDDQRGWHSGYHEGNELVDSREIALNDRTRLSFPVDYGRYRVEVSDESGTSLRYRFYAGYGAAEAELLGNRPDRVQLKLDRAAYRGGDTVKLHIAPPHDGEALVLVEGDRVLWQRRVEVSAKGSEMEIPVDPSWNRHDLYISVVAFRPGSRSEKATPARALGLIHLPLDRREREIKLAIEAPAKTQPETELQLRIKASNIGEETATVTVHAVDIGILNITRYATPDPFEFFLGKQRYSADALDLYGRLIETMEGRKGRLRFGGDAALRETRSAPKKNRMVDLYSGPVRLNEQGEADVRFKLPDFNGTLKLMAVVSTPSRYGHADAEVVSAAPIVAELALPRFLTPGDRATLALDLNNLSGAPQTLNVRVRTSGPVKVEHGAQQIDLDVAQKKILRLNVEATDVGLSGFEIEVKGGAQSGIDIKRHAALEVYPLGAQVNKRSLARLAPGESLKLDASSLEGYHPSSAYTNVTLSNVPAINVAGLVRGLLTYPYGCLEQTTSSAFPHVLIDEQTAEAYKLSVLPRDKREEAINGAVAKLAGMQYSSGVYSLWGNGPEEGWLTAYVSDFMKQARRAGYSVQPAPLERAEQWMLRQLQQSASFFPSDGTSASDAAKRHDEYLQWSKQFYRHEAARQSHVQFGSLAYMGYVLSLDDKAPLSALRTLHDDVRHRALSPLPLIHLGIALKRMGDEKRAAEAFDDAFSRGYGLHSADDWLGNYGSHLRDTALAYALIERHGIAHPRKENLFGELVAMLSDRRYLSTQEQLALVLAAGPVGLQHDKSWTAKIEAGRASEKLENGTQLRQFDAAQLKRGVVLRNTGRGTVFVTIETSGYPIDSPPPSSADAPIQIHRAFYDAAGKPIGDRPLRVGEQLLVHVQVHSAKRIEDGLVVDRVPAGLEVENLNLTQGNRLSDFKDPKPSNEEVARGYKRPYAGIVLSMTHANVKHREYREDRYVAAARLEGTMDFYYLARVVTPGRFVAPPSFAEDMYRPELHSSGRSGIVTVVDTQ